MAYKSYHKLWRSEFYNNVFAKNRVQDFNIEQLKHKVNDSFEKDEKMTTKIEVSRDKDVINKIYLDSKMSREEGYLLTKEKEV